MEKHKKIQSQFFSSFNLQKNILHFFILFFCFAKNLLFACIFFYHSLYLSLSLSLSLSFYFTFVRFLILTSSFLRRLFVCLLAFISILSSSSSSYSSLHSSSPSSTLTDFYFQKSEKTRKNKYFLRFCFYFLTPLFYYILFDGIKRSRESENCLV